MRHERVCFPLFFLMMVVPTINTGPAGWWWSCWLRGADLQTAMKRDVSLLIFEDFEGSFPNPPFFWLTSSGVLRHDVFKGWESDLSWIDWTFQADPFLYRQAEPASKRPKLNWATRGNGWQMEKKRAKAWWWNDCDFQWLHVCSVLWRMYSRWFDDSFFYTIMDVENYHFEDWTLLFQGPVSLFPWLWTERRPYTPDGHHNEKRAFSQLDGKKAGIFGMGKSE